MAVLGKLPVGENAFYINPIGGFNEPGEGVIFVIGTNLRGRHGAGAAIAAALRYGYPEGMAEGYSGQAYGIPTKDGRMKVLPLISVEAAIRRFVAFTHENHHLTFFVTPVGTGLAGHPAKVIAPMFRGAINCHFTHEWRWAFK